MIQFDLVSPEKKLHSGKVAMLTLPGTEGDFSVLAGHAPLIATMRVGVIDVYDQQPGERTQRIFVAGGLVEVTPHHCLVLAEEAVQLQEVNSAALQSEQRVLQERLKLEANPTEHALLEAKSAVLAAKLDALAAIE